MADQVCANCPLVNDVFPFHKNKLTPASKRGWERTKYDFHAGYNKACEDMQRKIDEAISAMESTQQARKVMADQVCANCPLVNDIIPVHEKYIAPVDKKAWEITKYDSRAGYNLACEDMQRAIDKAISGMAKK